LGGGHLDIIKIYDLGGDLIWTRVPEIEYKKLTTEEAMMKLIQDGGEFECEVKDCDGGYWKTARLEGVSPYQHHPFIVADAYCYKQCRIKENS